MSNIIGYQLKYNWVFFCVRWCKTGLLLAGYPQWNCMETKFRDYSARH